MIPLLPLVSSDGELVLKTDLEKVSSFCRRLAQPEKLARWSLNLGLWEHHRSSCISAGTKKKSKRFNTLRFPCAAVESSPVNGVAVQNGAGGVSADRQKPSPGIIIQWRRKWCRFFWVGKKKSKKSTKVPGILSSRLGCARYHTCAPRCLRPCQLYKMFSP